MHATRDQAAVRWAVALALAGSMATGLSAQVVAPFDADRAFIADETIFEPFRVTDEDTRPLREALRQGVLAPDSWLLIMEHEAGRLATVMDQLAYHHVAQGEIRGVPWMVSF